jgi:hypothetical protein
VKVLDESGFFHISGQMLLIVIFAEFSNVYLLCYVLAFSLFTLSVFLGQQTFVLGYIGRFRVTVLLWPSKKVNKTKESK